MKKLFLFLVCFGAIFAQDFEFVDEMYSTSKITYFNFDGSNLYRIDHDQLIIFDCNDLENILEINRIDLGIECSDAEITINNNFLVIDYTDYSANTLSFFIIDITSPETAFIVEDETYSGIEYYKYFNYSFTDTTISYYFSTSSTGYLFDVLYNGEIEIVDSSELEIHYNFAIEDESDDYWALDCQSEYIVVSPISEYEMFTTLDTIYHFEDELWSFSLVDFSDTTYLFFIDDYSTSSDSTYIKYGILKPDSLELIDSIRVVRNHSIRTFEISGQKFILSDKSLINITDLHSPEIEYPYIHPNGQYSSFDSVAYIINTNFSRITAISNIDSGFVNYYLPENPGEVIQFSLKTTQDSKLLLFLHDNPFHFSTPLYTENTYIYELTEEGFISHGILPKIQTYECEAEDRICCIDSLVFAQNMYGGMSVYINTSGIIFNEIDYFPELDLLSLIVYKNHNNNFWIFNRRNGILFEYDPSVGTLGTVDTFNTSSCQNTGIYETKDSTTHIFFNQFDLPVHNEIDNIYTHYIHTNFKIEFMDIDDSTFYLINNLDFYRVHKEFVELEFSIDLETDIEDYVIYETEENKYILIFSEFDLYIYQLNNDFSYTFLSVVEDFWDNTLFINGYSKVENNYLFSTFYEDRELDGSLEASVIKAWHIPSEILVDYEISEGWNMLSYPFNGKSVSDRLFPFAVGPLYNYDPETGYIPADTISCNHGFWLLSDRDTTVSFSSLATAQFYEDTLKAGFNLIGMPGTPLPASAILDYPHTIGGAYEYVPSLRTYTEPDTLTPTKGYWIFADSLVPYRLGL